MQSELRTLHNATLTELHTFSMCQISDPVVNVTHTHTGMVERLCSTYGTPLIPTAQTTPDPVAQGNDAFISSFKPHRK